MKTLLLTAAIIVLGSTLCFTQNKSNQPKKLWKPVQVETTGVLLLNPYDAQWCGIPEIRIIQTPYGLQPLYVDDCQPIAIKIPTQPEYPLFRIDNYFKIIKHPRRDITAYIIKAGGVESTDNTFYIRGSKSEPLVFIDGVKIRGKATIPAYAIEEVWIMAAGIPADIGDTDGGVILITTIGTGY